VSEPGELVCRPLGVVHSPFRERAEAPRQTAAAREVRGSIELLPGHDFEHALEDIEMWPYLWVLFWFHLNEGWRPKVLPPRSAKRRGLFATRAPYRPNPIGMSAVKLEKVEGLVLHVSALDMLDGTPVLDLKPYVPYADALPEAGDGWLEKALDPVEPFEVELGERAAWALGYLKEQHDIELESGIRKVLALGPQQHPYRRIKKDGDALLLAVKDWRARFEVHGKRLLVTDILTGYRPKELALSQDPAVEPHRAFERALARLRSS
jgi:tRNA-Thr(GGU) m(6)t(6)A37 methyltransferase TsaA